MNIEIANRLVNLRKKSSLSQEALAEKLGISRQAVSKWERAEASPDTDNLILLARLYGVSLDELLQTEDEIPMPEPETYISNGMLQNNDAAQGNYTAQSNATTQRNDTVQQAQDTDADSSLSHLLSLIIILAVVTAYIFIGCMWGAWHPGWLLFLIIPIWQSFVEAVRKHSLNFFAYPVVAVLIYLCLGFFLGMWHPGWIIFITIPLYYAVIGYVDALRRERRKSEQMSDKQMSDKEA